MVIDGRSLIESFDCCHIKTSVRFAVHRHLQVYKLPTCGNVHDPMEGVWISEGFIKEVGYLRYFRLDTDCFLKFNEN